jgi:transposase
LKGKTGNEHTQEVHERIQASGGAPAGSRANAAEVARALEVNPSELHRWRRQLQEHGEKAFSGAGRKRAEEGRVAELERKVGQQAMEIDFLERALQHVEEQRLLRALNSGAPSTSRSRKK